MKTKVKENNDYLMTKIADTKAIFTKRNKYNFSKFLEMNEETIKSFLNLEKLLEEENPEKIEDTLFYVPNAEHTNIVLNLDTCNYYKMVQYNNVTLKMPKPLCDGIVTKDKSKSLVVFPGDCIVVAGIDKASGTRFIFHAGWRGVAANIAKEMAKKLKEIGVSLKNMEIIIFPSISREFLTLDEKNAQSFKTYGDSMRWNEEIGQYNIDLISILESQLQQEGFDQEKIFKMDYCTYSSYDTELDEYKFNSYRRDKSIHRNAAILLGEYI
jgi:pseudouridylate synthase